MKTEAYMGQHDLREVRLTESERATLRRAAAILDDLRGRLEDGRQDFDAEPIVDVALAAATCLLVAREPTQPIYE